MEDCEINEVFPDEQLLQIMHLVQVTHTSWYADHVNFLASGITPLDLSYQQRKRFFDDIKHYFWEDPLLFKQVQIKLFGDVCLKMKWSKSSSNVIPLPMVATLMP